jgi:class 3 adenylate cyclase
MDVQSIYTTRRIADSVKNGQQAAIYTGKIQQQKLISAGAALGMLLLLLLSFFIYRNYSLQKKTAMALARANERISDEKAVSETLLLNILPEEVAGELKASGSVKPRLYENVSVLFTDFVDFTAMSGHISPQQLVEELHECFKAFDRIAGRYNIEKIKTVGDAYIAASGMPRPNPEHAADIVKAALEIGDYMRQRKQKFPGATFDIRIGINCGPVVAGIVGSRKFAYDIWGDTVNIAARMEQSCEPDKINISEDVYQLVKDKFTCECRGEIEVKGKGMMKMYYVS